MALSKVEIVIVKAISFLGVIQGLTWAVLSFICIVFYHMSQDKVFGSSYSELLEGMLYFRYLKDVNNPSVMTHGVVVRPSDFAVFMWIYFLSSAIWIAVSFDQYLAINWKKNRLSTVMILWSTTVILLSTVDIILMSLCARDYNNCNDIVESPTPTISSIYCYLTTGIVMTLAARGFILWIINVICCLVLLRIGVQIKTHSYMEKNLTIPRVKLTQDNRNSPIDWRTSAPFAEPTFLRENKGFA